MRRHRRVPANRACQRRLHQGGRLLGARRAPATASRSATPRSIQSTGPSPRRSADQAHQWMHRLDGHAAQRHDYLRRLTPDGTLTEWAGVANLNMGEVKVLRHLTAPHRAPEAARRARRSAPAQGKRYREVAITYTCCPTCGCQANPPRASRAWSRRTSSSPSQSSSSPRRPRAPDPSAAPPPTPGPRA